jgi:hypothetical protein
MLERERKKRERERGYFIFAGAILHHLNIIRIGEKQKKFVLKTLF